jgi:glycosyltransferase involved in cell wall biosynthesis
MKLVFWMKEFNFHWVDTLKQLSPIVNEKIVIVVQGEIGQARTAVGWSMKEEDEYSIVLIPRKRWKSEAGKIIRENKEAVHLFQGFQGGWCSRYFLPFIIKALKSGIKTVLMFEHYSTSYTGYHRDEPFIVSWLKAKLRPISYMLTANFLQKIDKGKQMCILALSKTAESQMERAGFPKEIIFPFGYFINKVNGTKRAEGLTKGPLNLIFFGSMIKRKGVDIAVDAINEINREKARVTLDVYGPGNPDSIIPSGSQFITYKGIVPQNQVQQTIARYDVLLLPSRHDGWGVVVNEALLQGVPVVVSDQVGASCLVQASKSGLVFVSGDTEDLEKQLLRLLNDRHLLAELQKNAHKTAGTITPKIAASYLFDVLNFYYLSPRTGKRPEANWY